MSGGCVGVAVLRQQYYQLQKPGQPPGVNLSMLSAATVVATNKSSFTHFEASFVQKQISYNDEILHTVPEVTFETVCQCFKTKWQHSKTSCYLLWPKVRQRLWLDKIHTRNYLYARVSISECWLVDEEIDTRNNNRYACLFLECMLWCLWLDKIHTRIYLYVRVSISERWLVDGK